MTNNGAAKNTYRNGRTALLTWGPPALMLTFILVLSLTPGSIYPEHPEIYNIMVHFLEFCFLSYFLARALVRSQKGNRWRILIWSVCLGTLIGITMELLQFSVPHRMFDVMDMIVDFSGAFIGGFIFIKTLKPQTEEGSNQGNLPETEDV